MNSLILTLDAGAGCCLPIAYQQLTQGALYAAWRGSYPQLHDEGFAGDGQTFTCSLLVRWRGATACRAMKSPLRALCSWRCAAR